MSVKHILLLVQLLAYLACAGCGKSEPDLVEYVYQLKPGMTQKEVEKILPHKYKKSEKETYPVVSILYRMSDRPPVRFAFYMQSEGLSHSPLSVYYDKNDAIVGFDYGSSNSPVLEKSRIKPKLLSEAEKKRKGLYTVEGQRKWFAHLEKLEKEKAEQKKQRPESGPSQPKD